jgi:hypothetical protein
VGLFGWIFVSFVVDGSGSAAGGSDVGNGWPGGNPRSVSPLFGSRSDRVGLSRRPFACFSCRGIVPKAGRSLGDGMENVPVRQRAIGRQNVLARATGSYGL